MKKILLFLTLCSGTVFSQIPSGAVGYWPFDNNAQDMSGNGNHGVVTAAIPYFDRFGNPNKAYKFNGTSSGITVPNSITTDIGPNEDFTFAIWEKAYSGNINTAILGKHTNGYWNGYFICANNQNGGYCTTNNHLMFYVAAGAQQDACSDGPLLADSSWHFLTGVYSSANQSTKLYVDGVLQSDIGSNSGTISNQANLSFGFNAMLNLCFFNGVLDGARMYKRALNEIEIRELYKETNSGTSQTVGIGAIPAELKVSLSPNPTKGRVMLVKENNGEELSIEVVNVMGQIILKQSTSLAETTINLESYPGGLYYIKLTGPESKQILKVIKE